LIVEGDGHGLLEIGGALAVGGVGLAQDAHRDLQSVTSADVLFGDLDLVGNHPLAGAADVREKAPAVDMDNSTLPLPALAAYNKPSGALKVTDIPSNFLSGGTFGSGTGFVSVTARSAPPLASQSGPNDNVNTGDNRFSGNVVLQNGSLWGTQAVSLSGRAAIEWYEINPTTAAVVQSGLISDPSLSLYYPSIAVNDFGDVVIGLSGSDDSTFISSYAAVGTTNAGTTTFSPIALLKAGQDNYVFLDSANRNRWGDYSATVVDPTNQRVFWTFQEFAAADRTIPAFGSIDNNWALQITQITVVPEPAAFWLATCGVVGLLRMRRRFVSR
jgi:hypothetical protein